ISIGILGVPAGSIESLHASAGDVVMLGLSDEVIATTEETSGYQRYDISKDAYPFLDKDVPTIAAFAVMVGNTDTIDEELRDQLYMAIGENSNENTHAQAAQQTPANGLNGLDGYPLLPGAKRYHEEQGLTINAPVAELTATAEVRKVEITLGTGSQGGTY